MTMTNRSSLKLNPELIPKTCWYSNVRDHVTKSQWDIIRKHVYARAGHKCVICNGHGKEQGFNHRVEAHETWDYNHRNNTQTLTNILSLCPECHRCMHLGLAKVKGWYDRSMEWLAEINNMNPDEAHFLSECAFADFNNRSNYEWSLNLDYLAEYYNLKVEIKR
jgi:hypothetical protein